MTFTRRQVLGGLAGLAVVGLGAGGARLWLARPQVAAGVRLRTDRRAAGPGDRPGLQQSGAGLWRPVPRRGVAGEAGRVAAGALHQQAGQSRPPSTGTASACRSRWTACRTFPSRRCSRARVSSTSSRPRTPGSYWYHPHLMSSEQLGRGLVGPLIIEEREPTGFRHEKVLCLKTWHVDEQGRLHPLQRAAPGCARRHPRALFDDQRQACADHRPAGRADRPGAPAERRQHRHLPSPTCPTARRGSMPSMAIRWNRADSRAVLDRPGMRLELALKVPEAGTELSLRDGPVRAWRRSAAWPAPRLLPATGRSRCRRIR